MKAPATASRWRARRGMVLIAVLWIVAALSLIVTGIVHVVRDEVRQVSGAGQVLQGRALGAGAGNLVLQQMLAQPERLKGMLRTQVVLQGRPVQVEVVPLNGLIDINTATLPLLQNMYAIVGGLVPEQAAALAQATLDSRGQKSANGRPQPFESVEDLLAVPGMDYDTYARVADIVTPDARSGGRVNVQAAPFPVLLVLAQGRQDLAQRIQRDRDAGAVGLDTTGLDPQYVDNAASQRYLLRARVPLEDGTVLLTNRWLDFADARREGLPWRVFHVDDRREPPSR